MSTDTTKAATQTKAKPNAEHLANPAELAAKWIDVMRLSGELFQNYAHEQAKKGVSLPSDELGMVNTFKKFADNLLKHPAHLFEEQMKAWWDYYELWNNTFMGMMGFGLKPVVDAQGDGRWKSPSWQESFVFYYIKQSYLILAHRFLRVIADSRGMNEHEQKKLLFFSRSFINALSPSNFVLTNPEVLRVTINSGGQNLVNGLKHLLEDLNAGKGSLQTKMTDEKSFELGVNVASTPGKVVFQNRIMQLIQYAPSTEKVYKKPLLIIPPWINKFYVLDLQPKNSFVKYCVDQGYTTFIISWTNPDESLSDLMFDDYLREGTLKAIEVALAITGEKELNAVSYCLGGTLLSSTLAYMAKKKINTVASATFFTTLIDFSVPGDLGVFIDEAQVKSLEKKMSEHGYLDGGDMASTFNMLRDNDLIWSFIVNNYLMGRDPLPFDLLYWNSDSTRMPAAMHSYYLRNMYMENKLKDPNGLSLLDTPLDMREVKVPSCFVSAIEDHIAPWKGTYLGARLFSGPTRFMLGGSGHIAGIINPAQSGKYFYMVNDSVTKLPDDPEKWMSGADRRDGSWWSEWSKWAQIHNAQDEQDKIPARQPGNQAHKPLEDAPGSYVRVRVRPKR